MPFYVTKFFRITSVSALAITLTACGSLPEKPVTSKKNSETPIVVEKTKAPLETDKVVKKLSLTELKTLRSQAVSSANWPDYLRYSTSIWNLSENNPRQQEQIEDQAWSIIRSLSQNELQVIAQSNFPEVQAWSTLQQAFSKNGYAFKQALLNIQTFESNAIYQKHLLTKLIELQPKAKPLQQIAVLLPMQGKYKVISKQIRSGIMKAFFASDQTITLKFYDSSDIENLEAIYTQAKQDGAERIIGPLRKQALQELASFHDENLVALNSIKGSSFTQFSFKSSNSSQQMLNRFQSSGYQRLGILTNDAKKSLQPAEELKTLWKLSENHAEVSVYPNDKPKLRKALGALIHEKESKERKNNLRWLIGRDLSFFPRTRQDLDAIVIYDSAHRLSVFRPQFDFFELDTPMFSDKQLTPKNFQEIKANPDLNKVQFLTYPAVLSPVDLSSKFEAFGWDSFVVTTFLNELKNGACLTDTKTGILSLENNQIKQKLIWAKYNKQGVIQEAPMVLYKPIEEQ